MHFLIGAIGVIQMLGGIAAYSISKSAMHEIFFAVMFGAGSICLGLAVVISRLTPGLDHGQRSAAQSPVYSMPQETLIRTHKGRRIVKAPNGAIMVDGREFSGVLMAERYIDNQPEK